MWILTYQRSNLRTTVGSSLAEKIGCSFSDADEFHSDANKTKMSNGQPLTDQDRFPWLLSIHEFMSKKQREGQTLVVTCSALKKSYRDILKYGGHTDRCMQSMEKSGSIELIQKAAKAFNFDDTAQSTEDTFHTQPKSGHKECVQALTGLNSSFEVQEETELKNYSNAEQGPNEDSSNRNIQKHEKSIGKNDVYSVTKSSDHSKQKTEETNKAHNNREVVQSAETYKKSNEKPDKTEAKDRISPIFVHLTGSPAVLEDRLSNRKGHFMPKSLLQSQLDALEPLGSDEEGFTVDIDKKLEDLVSEIISSLEVMKY